MFSKSGNKIKPTNSLRDYTHKRKSNETNKISAIDIIL